MVAREAKRSRMREGISDRPSGTGPMQTSSLQNTVQERSLVSPADPSLRTAGMSSRSSESTRMLPISSGPLRSLRWGWGGTCGSPWSCTGRYIPGVTAGPLIVPRSFQASSSGNPRWQGSVQGGLMSGKRCLLTNRQAHGYHPQHQLLNSPLSTVAEKRLHRGSCITVLRRAIAEGKGYIPS